MATRTALEDAMREGRLWRDLSFAATYLQIELEKDRISEKRALEKLLPAIPECAHGRLIKTSLLDSRDLRRELDDVAVTAEMMANAMAQIAPFNRFYWGR